MGRCQVSNTAACQDSSVDHILDDPIVPCQPSILLGKLFRKYTGTGLKEYIAQQKMLKAKSLLLTTDMSIKQIAHELGYAEENLFIKFFAYHEEISPAVFRAQCYNTHINNK